MFYFHDELDKSIKKEIVVGDNKNILSIWLAWDGQEGQEGDFAYIDLYVQDVWVSNVKVPFKDIRVVNDGIALSHFSDSEKIEIVSDKLGVHVSVFYSGIGESRVKK